MWPSGFQRKADSGRNYAGVLFFFSPPWWGYPKAVSTATQSQLLVVQTAPGAPKHDEAWPLMHKVSFSCAASVPALQNGLHRLPKEPFLCILWCLRYWDTSCKNARSTVWCAVAPHLINPPGCPSSKEHSAKTPGVIPQRCSCARPRTANFSGQWLSLFPPGYPCALLSNVLAARLLNKSVCEEP